MTLPALVPTIKSGLMSFASRALMTPMCAKPRAAPPPSAKPIIGGLDALRGGGGVGVLQAQSSRSMPRKLNLGK